jgi:60 kDa SS-A/Ro ribonucleoprotein
VKLNKVKAEGDLVIMVSDNESWADARCNRGTVMMNEWQKFKGRNPQSKLVCIDIQPNANSQVQDRKDVLNIGGFSDQIFKVIAAFHRGGFEGQGFIREIEATQV